MGPRNRLLTGGLGHGLKHVAGSPGEGAIRVRALRQNSPTTRFRLSSRLSERLSSGEYAAYR